MSKLSTDEQSKTQLLLSLFDFWMKNKGPVSCSTLNSNTLELKDKLRRVSCSVLMWAESLEETFQSFTQTATSRLHQTQSSHRDHIDYAIEESMPDFLLSNDHEVRVFKPQKLDQCCIPKTLITHPDPHIAVGLRAN